MIAKSQPLLKTLPVVFSSNDLARRLLLVCGKDLFFAIVLADDIKDIGEAVVVIICALDIRAETSIPCRTSSPKRPRAVLIQGRGHETRCRDVLSRVPDR